MSEKETITVADVSAGPEGEAGNSNGMGLPKGPLGMTCESSVVPNDRPWRDENVLGRLYVEEQRTTREIADLLGCSRKTVGNWIRRYDLKEESFPWRDEDTLSTLRSEGLSESAIADRLGCSQTTVHNWLRNFELDTSRTLEERPWHEEDTLRELYVDQGLTMSEISDELDCSIETVQDWIHRHEIDTRSRNPDPPKELTHGEALRFLYRDRELSTYEIGSRVDCAPSAVFNWLRKHDIDTRDVGSHPGSLHHRWAGGGDPYYGENWSSRRELALERDDWTCQRCGIERDHHRESYGIGLDVHHRRPICKYENPSEANELVNLVTLCRACHNRIEGDDDSDFYEDD